jgi:hypothetical protein
MYEECVEVSVMVPPEKQRIAFRAENKDDVLNCEGIVFRVKLKDDYVSYAVDPSGAEFGQYEPILEWDDYIKKISPSSMEVNSHGSCADNLRAQEKLWYGKLQKGGEITIDQPGRKNLMQSYVTNLMNLVVDAWLWWRDIKAVEGLNRTKWQDGIVDMKRNINDEIQDLLRCIDHNGGIVAFDYLVCNAVGVEGEELSVEGEEIVCQEDGYSTEMPAGFIARLKKLRLED